MADSTILWKFKRKHAARRLNSNAKTHCHGFVILGNQTNQCANTLVLPIKAHVITGLFVP